jgi:hypothetical protein
LVALNPQRIWDELHALAAPIHQPVLISYEAAVALSPHGREAGTVSSVRELSQ